MARRGAVMAELAEAQHFEAFDMDDSDMYWTTKEGKRIYIHDLPNGHLVNIIKMLRRKAPPIRLAAELAEIVSARPYGQIARGEAARDCLEEALKDGWERTDEEWLLDEHPQYMNLISEALGRKLNLEDPTR